VTVDKQLERIRHGTVQVFPEQELRERLASGRPLRVKLGVDPTAPDLHLGHTVVLEKLRQLQELGHHATLIIGDYTALVGDPSGRSATRPQLTREEVDHNAETYQAQAFKVLDRARTEVRRNGEWFAEMRLGEVIALAGQMTVARMLERDDFAGRYKAGNPIGIHEFLYPLMQGWDSVMVKSDIEMGGTDQTFNLLVGRDLQRTAGQLGQIAITLPLLVGTDGVQKMSKSLGNQVGIAEPPEEIYGKLMSISDELMDRYGLLLLGEEPSWVAQKDAHPLERKKVLASLLVARFHGESAALRARTYFEERFQRRADFAPTPVVLRTGESAIWICKLLKEIGFAASTSAARRLASEGAVRVDGAVVDADYQFRRGTDRLVSVGRRRIAAVAFEDPMTDGDGD
jgi:tyrosyl-tRNA synthetase